jgi:hypothetical protein
MKLLCSEEAQAIYTLVIALLIAPAMIVLTVVT